MVDSPDKQKGPAPAKAEPLAKKKPAPLPKHPAPTPKPTAVATAQDAQQDPALAGLRQAPDSAVLPFIADGERANTEMISAGEVAAAIYHLIEQLIVVNVTNRQNDERYSAASKEYEALLTPSTFQKTAHAIGTLIEIGTSIADIVAGARALYAAAKEATEVRNLARIAEDHTADSFTRVGSAARVTEIEETSSHSVGALTKETIKAGKGASKVENAVSDELEPRHGATANTMLSDANATAIHEAGEALRNLGRGNIVAHLEEVKGFAALGTTDFRSATRGISQVLLDYAAISNSRLAEFKANVDRFAALQAQYVARIERVAALLRAYDAGGAQGLADRKEGTLFSTIQGWIANKDPRVNALHVALDQDMKAVEFGGVVVDVDANPKTGILTEHYCYEFSERGVQAENATLYATSGSAVQALLDLGLPPATDAHRGLAESVEDEKQGMKFAISASIAKAIASLGVRGSRTDAKVQLWHQGAPKTFITSKDRGKRFEDWPDTEEFAAFWRTDLGGTYGYIRRSGGSRQPIPAAELEGDVMARSAIAKPLAPPGR